MKREVKKSNWIFLGIMFLILIPVIYFKYGFGISQLELDTSLKILISIGLSLICVLGIYLLIRFDILKKGKSKEEKEKEKQLIKSLSTDSIRQMIKENRESNKSLEKEFDKRKDKTIGEIIRGEFDSIITGGLIISIVGLFYLGALPNYFGVNDELINPTNGSLGLKAAMDLVQNTITTHIFIKFHDIGASNPTFWFWFWWVTVFMCMIYPVGKIVWFIIKKYLNKGGK